MKNYVNPTQFTNLYILNDQTIPIHVGFEINFDFDDGRHHETLEYIAVLRSVTDDLSIYIDHICGGCLYVKKIRNNYYATQDIYDSLIEFAERRKRKPKFIVDANKYFEKVGKFYESMCSNSEVIS